MKLYDWYQSPTHVYIYPYTSITLTETGIHTCTRTDRLFRPVRNIFMVNGTYVLEKCTREMWTSLVCSDAAAEVQDVCEKRQTETLDEFFMRLYREGSDEQKRAMDKSYYMSRGGTLSTDWRTMDKDDGKDVFRE